MIWKFLGQLVLVALISGPFAGCVNYSEKIVFTSEPAPYQSPAPPPVLALGLSRAEVTQVERAVFAQLLQRDFGDGGDYSAVFLKADERETGWFQKQFPRHIPPIKQLWHADLREGFAPVDKVTGRAALWLSAEVTDPENGIVTGLGRWNGGAAVKGFHSYKLQKKGAEWLLEVAK